MRDPATGFWRHVTNNGQWEGAYFKRPCMSSLKKVSDVLPANDKRMMLIDANFWGTGMAWVAAGMTRSVIQY